MASEKAPELTDNLLPSLTACERKAGRRRLALFGLFNAISFSCIGGDFLQMYAQQFGGGPAQLGILASFIFFMEGLGLLAIKPMRRMGSAKWVAFIWIIRCVLASLLIFIPYVARYFGDPSAVYSIIIIFALFNLVRSQGVVGWKATVDAIVEDKTRGQFFGNMIGIFRVGMMGTYLVLHWIFSQYDDISVFQWIIAFGVSLGLASSFIISKISIPGARADHSQDSIRLSFKKVFQHPIISRWIIPIGIIVFSGATFLGQRVVMYKNRYDYDDAEKSNLTVIMLIGAIAGALLGGRLIDRFKPFKMFLLAGFGILLMNLVLTIEMEAFYIIAIAIAAYSFFVTAMMTMWGALIMTYAPQTARYGFLVISGVSVSFSAGLGAFSSGYIYKAVQHLYQAEGEIEASYQAYFRVIAAITFLGLLLLAIVGERKRKDIKIEAQA